MCTEARWCTHKVVEAVGHHEVRVFRDAEQAVVGARVRKRDEQVLEEREREQRAREPDADPLAHHQPARASARQSDAIEYDTLHQHQHQHLHLQYICIASPHRRCSTQSAPRLPDSDRHTPQLASRALCRESSAPVGTEAERGAQVGEAEVEPDAGRHRAEAEQKSGEQRAERRLPDAHRDARAMPEAHAAAPPARRVRRDGALAAAALRAYEWQTRRRQDSGEVETS